MEDDVGAPEPHPDFFSDPDVDAARAAGGMRVGRTRVRLPAVFGFCGGVRSALRRVCDLLGRIEPGRTVWLLGELIHNDTVNARLRGRNVRILPEDRVENICGLARPGDVLVIPAFGLPESSERRIRSCLDRKCLFLDVTCGYVRRVWNFVRAAAAEGRTVVIHGKPGHAETRATVSRALTPFNAVVLAPDVEAGRRLAECIRRRDASGYPREWLLQLENLRFDKVALANQTTMLCSETDLIGRMLADAVHAVGGDLVNPRTVCRATEERQKAAYEACARGCDLFLVIGGKTSSNTAQLYRLARRFCPGYFITEPGAFDRDSIRHFLPDEQREVVTHDWLHPDVRDIVVLAGASCPESDVGAVLRRLRTILAHRQSGDR